MNHLYTYLNYRDYLRDYYAEKKEAHSFFSYRLFAQKAGFKSPNFLKLVIQGQRNLGKESVFRFVKALSLGKKEGDYFENLVFFNQSDSLEEKNTYLSRLMRYRTISDPKKIEESEFKYYEAWYHPVIRELATALDFRNDYRALAQMVIPAISPADAQRSVELLESLEFIKRNKDQRFVKTAASLTTGPQVRSVAIARFHQAMIALGSDSVERFPSAQRDISSLTLSISEVTFKQITDKLHAFRKELLELAEADDSANQVVQINFQLFPLSRLFANKKVTL